MQPADSAFYQNGVHNSTIFDCSFAQAPRSNSLLVAHNAPACRRQSPGRPPVLIGCAYAELDVHHL